MEIAYVRREFKLPSSALVYIETTSVSYPLVVIFSIKFQMIQYFPYFTQFSWILGDQSS